MNGLRSSSFKLLILLAHMLENNIDMLAITETNTSSTEGFHKLCNLSIDYPSVAGRFRIYWSDRDNKNKGSGVALIVSNKWGKHYWKHVAISPYRLIVYFAFHGCVFDVNVLYSAPSADKSVVLAKAIEEACAPYVLNPLTNNTTILLGDFNLCYNSAIDRFPPTDAPINSYLSVLTNHGFKDTYRELYASDDTGRTNSNRLSIGHQ